MAKKKTEEVVTDKVSDRVSVEMSVDESEAFADFMRAKKEDQEPIPAKGRTMAVHLTYKHNINGKSFGPGRVLVPEEITGQLLFADDQQKRQELALHSNKKRLMKILNDGNVQPVAVDTVKGF